jgi:hypothetical protein
LLELLVVFLELELDGVGDGAAEVAALGVQGLLELFGELGGPAQLLLQLFAFGGLLEELLG